MTIQEIYEKYKVMPSLQKHMLRVTAVASVMCDWWKGEPIDRDLIVKTCLLHDLANILKFDMSLYPDLFEPEGVDYRAEVKEWTKQFGAHEHEATLVMCEEIWVDERRLSFLREFSDYHIDYKIKSSSMELKICEYADLSVTPFGIVSVEERIENFHGRVVKNHGISTDRADEIIWGLRKDVEILKEQLLVRCSYSANDIISRAQNIDLTALRDTIIVE